MAKIYEICDYLNSICPENLAEEWDNVGFLIGDKSKDVTKIMVCLDVDLSVAKEAYENKANFIISHHPVIFNPVKRLTEDNEKLLRYLIKNDISVYSAHTNLDVVCGGLNDLLAKKTGLENTEILVPVKEFDGKMCGYGRYAKLEKPAKLKDVLNSIKQSLGNENLRFCGDEEKNIEYVAVNSGGGSSMMEFCFDKKIDLYITGDFKYNLIRDAYENDFAVIDAGHYETEIIAMDWFLEKLNVKFNDIDIIKSKENKNPVSFLKN